MTIGAIWRSGSSSPSNGHTLNARFGVSRGAGSCHSAHAALPTDPGIPDLTKTDFAPVARSIRRYRLTPYRAAASTYDPRPPLPAGTEKNGWSTRHSFATE